MVLRGIYNALSGIALRKFASQDKAKSLAMMGLSKPHVWHGRNGLLDIDANLHMNNASYVNVAELARWHLSGLNGLLGMAWSKKLVFLVASQHFLYRAAIPPFAPFVVITKVDAIDEKWIYMWHTFQRPKFGNKPRKVYCEASVKAIIKGMDGSRYSPAALMTLMGLPQNDINDMQSPEHLDRYTAYSQLDDLTHQDAKVLSMSDEN